MVVRKSRGPLFFILGHPPTDRAAVDAVLGDPLILPVSEQKNGGVREKRIQEEVASGKSRRTLTSDLEQNGEKNDRHATRKRDAGGANTVKRAQPSLAEEPEANAILIAAP